jgi:hypothetical protein
MFEPSRVVIRAREALARLQTQRRVVCRTMPTNKALANEENRGERLKKRLEKRWC